MTRFLVPVALACAALLFAAPVVHADEVFHLILDPTIFGGSGDGTITLVTDPGDGIFNFKDYNPTVDFTYHGYTFSQNGIYDFPNAQFTLSDLSGQRRFQFGDGGSRVFIDVQPSGGGFYEIGLGSDTYTTSEEIGSSYSALVEASDVPEPGTVALFGGMGLAVAGCLRRRARRSA